MAAILAEIHPDLIAEIEEIDDDIVIHGVCPVCEIAMLEAGKVLSFCGVDVTGEDEATTLNDDFLCDVCWPGHPVHCPTCNSTIG